MLKKYISEGGAIMPRWYNILLFCVLIIGVATRTYRISAPIADWHSWRQADTAAVARNFVTFGFDPLRPRYGDLSNIASGKDNPMGWRMVEFPLYQLVAAAFSKLFPFASIEIWLRLTTIASQVGSIILLTRLVTKYSGRMTGLLAGLIFAVLPYSIYYGRTALPEPFAVFWALASLFFLSKVPDYKGKTHWMCLIGSAACAAIALLVKPTAIFLLLPLPYLLYRAYSISANLIIRLFVYSLICLLPFMLWRQWITQFPEGIPVYQWLFNEGNIRFKGAWFYWLFAERLAKLILGYWGVVLLAIGLVQTPPKKEGWLYLWFLFGGLANWIVIARGNVQHDYYQILIIPVVCIYVAKGISFLAQTNVFSRWASYAVLTTISLFMLAFSWYYIRTYYWINRPAIIEAGIDADERLPKDAKVIAPYNGDTTFLYQTNRQGWPIGFDMEKKIASGATHYVTVSPTDSDLETRDLAERFTVVVRNDTYAIIDLTKPKEAR